ncbi:RluA family pseudouridine synthase [Alicyclobacillus dauci]|uniref:Pseudouridine synthase n=1 Tax=Alicyclobacillus dauci TaxID=1475485 RepID=A0ABY6YZA1_9BACL|nr:RluA family pseudouridine synthase [Alicyclobacillus dauci]WAH35451.1 RluA family pseudouridine synthase [Alicyclobacillus dauci]
MVSVIIDKADDGKQVHKWLRLLLPGMPLSGIHKFIRTGRIKVNGKRAKRDTVLHQGDAVNLYMTEEDYEASRKRKREKFSGVQRNVDVRYEDDELVIVNKPAGTLVHSADGTDYASTLQAQVEAYVHDRTEMKAGQAFSPAPVHRLDRNTSGLVIFAKTSRAAKAFGEAFQSGVMEKDYITLVTGTVRKPGKVAAALIRANEEVTRVDERGKESYTSYEPVATAGGTTLLSVRIESGRTHQIRAHLSHIGHPLVGDVKYGARRQPGETFYLHAAHLSVGHELDVTAPLPGRFVRKLTSLGYRMQELQEMLARFS